MQLYYCNSSVQTGSEVSLTPSTDSDVLYVFSALTGLTAHGHYHGSNPWKSTS